MSSAVRPSTLGQLRATAGAGRSKRVKDEVRDNLIVRVRSRQNTDNPLPDAVFSFRPGDPQYQQWERRMTRQTAAQGVE